MSVVIKATLRKTEKLLQADVADQGCPEDLDQLLEVCLIRTGAELCRIACQRITFKSSVKNLEFCSSLYNIACSGAELMNTAQTTLMNLYFYWHRVFLCHPCFG